MRPPDAQPMGFYAPAQLVRDAQADGVEVRPVDVNHSRWNSTLEAVGGDRHAVRLGLRCAKGLANADGARIVAARGERPYRSIPILAPAGSQARRWCGWPGPTRSDR